MRGLDPRIHIGIVRRRDVDGRIKYGHDEVGSTCEGMRTAMAGRYSVSVSDGHATGRDCGPPLMRRPRGGAGRRPAAVSDKEVRAFPCITETL